MFHLQALALFRFFTIDVIDVELVIMNIWLEKI